MPSAEEVEMGVSIQRRPLGRLFVSFFTVWFFIFTCVSWGWARDPEVFDPYVTSLALVSIVTAPNEKKVLTDTANHLREKLSHLQGLHVIADQTVDDVTAYHAPAIRKDAVFSDAEKYLGLAKTHWFDKQYAEAEATIDRALDAFRKDPAKGALLIDALLTKSMIFQETKRISEAKALFEEVLTINPAQTTEGLPLGRTSRSLFNQSRQSLQNKGSIEIESVPAGVSVLINGIKKGLTPLTVQGLVEGGYLVTLEANHYKSLREPLYITANTTQYLTRTLQWQKDEEKPNTPLAPMKSQATIQAEIKRAAQIGEVLKADKVLLLTMEHRGDKDLVVVRMVDTALKAAYNPLALSLDDILNHPEKAFASLSGDVRSQTKVSILKNPQAHLEPDMGDVRVLRRKPPFIKSPAFYTIVGAVIGVAIGTGLGFLLDDGGTRVIHNSGDAGGVDIRFE